MTDLPAIEPAYFDDALASKLTGNNETMPLQPFCSGRGRAVAGKDGR